MDTIDDILENNGTIEAIEVRYPPLSLSGDVHLTHSPSLTGSGSRHLRAVSNPSCRSGAATCTCF
jgi:hypothetical protein